ncbi:DUF4404 family protein [Pseudomonas sp. RIT-PI-S]|uniref:DUF4404 family protein n=1 Tax=Pseudomonas sp. RIT-PI-S TaxID=3035295 RepID=UPI0021D952F6|nr:DUF4404 family protein [Pseudomonas sp. RIT-PI-S]
MPVQELQAQLDALREELDRNPPATQEERDELAQLMQQIEARVQLENATHADSLVDNVNYAAERFEVKHPGLAGALRNVIQTLGNIGV